MPIEVIRGNIVELEIDAIVNAANSSLLGGGGVDGAIHRAAGPELVRECATLGGCKTGDAKATRAYKLRAQRVIHTVGPVWRGGAHGEDDLLESCYRRAAEVALEEGCRAIAFPAISTGRYHFPIPRAAAIAVRTMQSFTDARLERIVFCCFDAETELAHRNALETHDA